MFGGGQAITRTWREKMQWREDIRLLVAGCLIFCLPVVQPTAYEQQSSSYFLQHGSPIILVFPCDLLYIFAKFRRGHPALMGALNKFLTGGYTDL